MSGGSDRSSVLVLVLVLAGAGCGRIGFAAEGEAVPDGGLSHIAVPTGWKAEVFRDFSAEHTFRTNDFLDGVDNHSNEPEWLFALRPPFPSVLGVVAGRDVIELSDLDYVAHTYANHAPNANTAPDQIETALVVDDHEALGPHVLLAATSADQGDGVFAVPPTWSVSRTNPLNNTRCVAWDAVGAVDGVPALYLGAKGGVFRHPDFTTIVIAGDTTTMRVVGDDLMLVRQVTDGDDRLIVVRSITPPVEIELARRASIRVAEGDPPAPGRAWAILDDRQLARVDLSGIVDVVAELTEPGFVWRGATTPPAEHPLAGAGAVVYVLESNRALDIDRVVRLTAP